MGRLARISGLPFAGVLLLALALLTSVAAQVDPPATGEEAAASDGSGSFVTDPLTGESRMIGVAPPPPPAALLPEVAEAEVIDVPNDDGQRIGVLWRWVGQPSETLTAAFEVKGDSSWLDSHTLTADEQSRLDSVAAEYQPQFAELVPAYDAAEAEKGAKEAAFTVAQVNKAPESELAPLRDEMWAARAAFKALERRRSKLRDAVVAKVGPLIEKEANYQYLSAALDAAAANGGWLATNAAAPAAELGSPKASAPNRFGLNPADPDKLYVEIENLILPAPPEFELGTKNRYDQDVQRGLRLPLEPGRTYEVRLTLADGGPPVEEGAQPTVSPASAEHMLGSATARTNYYNSSKSNNTLMAVVFAAIILAGIFLARRNPNLFIRRIAGLEAVDEAIGRATEMGKPVLYLNGMTTLADLPTLAALNILGRVARRVADYDSALIVPCRDPVVLSVAQEVVREGFIDQGRPDAYREDNIFFVTEDQFSYTASVCALMVRDKPAANFFMGYYYAESLLLAETGANTGAIQIAGTDSQSQLPFFITACDYTLIGEELYAASAYLSREPMLLGSLKGQDVGKAVIMLLILAQTIMFVINPELSFLQGLVTPL